MGRLRDSTFCSLWPSCGFGLLGKGQFNSSQQLSLPTRSPLQSEGKWVTQIAELEKERGRLVNAMARREEEFSALQEQLENTQLKLSSTQASSRHPWLTMFNFTPWPERHIMEAGGCGRGLGTPSLMVKASVGRAPDAGMP